MKVIKGKSEKALKIIDIIKQNGYKKILILGIFAQAFCELSCDYFKFDSNRKLPDIFTDNGFITGIKSMDYELLVFYTNDAEDNLDPYRVLQGKLDAEMIVSIQSNNEKLEIYEF